MLTLKTADFDRSADCHHHVIQYKNTKFNLKILINIVRRKISKFWKKVHIHESPLYIMNLFAIRDNSIQSCYRSYYGNISVFYLISHNLFLLIGFKTNFKIILLEFWTHEHNAQNTQLWHTGFIVSMMCNPSYEVVITPIISWKSAILSHVLLWAGFPGSPFSRRDLWWISRFAALNRKFKCDNSKLVLLFLF